MAMMTLMPIITPELLPSPLKFGIFTSLASFTAVFAFMSEWQILHFEFQFHIEKVSIHFNFN